MFAGHGTTPQIDACLARVVRRLNVLRLQRAIYRIASALLLAACVGAVCAEWLPARGFRAVFSVLVIAVLAIVAASLLALRAGWTGPLSAAHRVEETMALDQRLLTLVAADATVRRSRLWPELVRDNLEHLPRWGESRLGIARVPGNVVLLLLSLVLAAFMLAPVAQAPPETSSDQGQVAAQADDAGPSEAARPRGAEPAAGGSAVAGDDDLGGVEDAERDGAALGDRLASAQLKLDQLQAGLASDFERSLAGGEINDRLGAGSGATHAGERLAHRPDSLPSSDAESRAEAGGRLPPEGLARLETGSDGANAENEESEDRGAAATGQARARAETGAGSGDRAAGTRQAGGGNAGAQSATSGGGRGLGGDSASPGRKPGSPSRQDGARGNDPLQSKGSGGPGGPGAGAGAATGSLLAAQPVLMGAGQHQSARFGLTLGAASGSGRDPSGERRAEVDPRGEIAEAARGAQGADRPVRHEEIPPEYESAIKRLFAREP